MNTEPGDHIHQGSEELTGFDARLSGNCQDSVRTDWRQLAVNDPIFRKLIQAWPTLGVAVRYQVAALCLATVAEVETNAPQL